MFLLNFKRLATAAALLALLLPAYSRACPFCSAVSQTFTEEINSVDVVVIAKIIPTASTAGGKPPRVQDVEKSRFEIIQVIKGEQALGNTKEIEVLFFGQQPKETRFLIMGVEPPQIAWNAPVPLSDRAVQYIGKLSSLPEKGGERLRFFQEHLEDVDEMLARDAYDEFAKAPYSDVKELKPHMKREQLLEWIQDKSVLASRKRLYLTMLGVCGTPDDTKVLEEMITRKEPAGEPKQALDAMIACYLTLKGAEGMPIIENEFLKNEKAEYSDTYAAIMALRFHGQEEKIIPKERLVEAMRHMLNRPQMADLIIPDLARWQDWASMDKLVELFKKADEKSSWVRVPVVQFVKACPLPEAKERLAELAQIDAEAVKRASFFVPIGGGAPMPPKKGPAENVAAAATDTPAAQTPGAAAQAAPSQPAQVSEGPNVAAKPAETPKEQQSEPPRKDASAAQPSEQETGAALVPPAAKSQSVAQAGPSSPKESSPAEAANTRSQSEAATAQSPPSSTAAPPPTAVSQASRPSSSANSSAEPENSRMLVFVPLGVGVVLFVLLLVILRGVGAPAAS